MKRRGIQISIKDPFLKLENHGYWLKDEKNFHQLILKVKEFIFSVQQGRIEDFIIQTELKPNDKDSEDQLRLQQARNEKLKL